MLGCLCKCTAFVVALCAILVGLLTSGVLAQHTSLFQWLDETDVFGRKILLGLTPHFHQDKPWGYTFEQLRELDLASTRVLITGGNSGLGYWSAYHLARSGAQVGELYYTYIYINVVILGLYWAVIGLLRIVIACRNVSKCASVTEELSKDASGSVEAMQCDLASFESILGFADKFKQKYDSLDSIILNAGLGGIPFSKTQDGIELQIGMGFK